MHEQDIQPLIEVSEEMLKFKDISNRNSLNDKLITEIITGYKILYLNIRFVIFISVKIISFSYFFIYENNYFQMFMNIFLKKEE